MTLKAPTIDPVLFCLGDFSIRWYGLSYFVGILLGYLHIRKILESNKVYVNLAQLDEFLPWAPISVVFGGRLMYALCYAPEKYLKNPMDILRVYEGGMSFHGGLIGLCLASYLFCKKHKIKWMAFVDLLSIAAPIGIACGRVANFINQELYGRATSLPWGVVFSEVDHIPRHPSQIYEALFEGVLIFITLNFLVNRRKMLKNAGTASGLFCMLYSAARMAIEFVREPDIEIGFFAKHYTIGQILSLPMVLIGAYFIWQSYPKKAKSAF